MTNPFSVLRIWLFAVLLFAEQASATEAFPLSESEIYARCYIKLTRQIPDESSPVFSSLQAGTTTAVNECMKLVDEAMFNSQNRLANPANGRAREVLRFFHDIHLDWFQSKAPEGIERTDFALRDFEEPALYLTRALFGGQQYRSIVTSTTSLRGERIVDSSSASRFLKQTFFRYSGDTAGYSYSNQDAIVVRYPTWEQVGDSSRRSDTSYTFPDSALVAVGDLVGVELLAPLQLPPTRILEITASSPLSWKTAIENYENNFQLHSHPGGGILGSAAYILSNTNLPSRQIPLEYDIIHRRLAGRVYEDLLCHNLPTLSEADVAGLLVPTSKHTFQRTTSCMQCHASLDHVAFTYRNHYWAKSGNPNELGAEMSFVYRLPASSNHPIFAAQPPRGSLHYRSLIDRTEVKLDVNGLAELGSALAGSRDLYLCAAKKYYFALTGIDVQLATPEPTTNSTRAFHQSEVVRLGDALRTHQSLRTLIREIFDSPSFKARDFKRTEPK